MSALGNGRKSMPDEMIDVLVIGYGPVSQILSLILGRQGRRVAVVERWLQRYPLPRAVCVDHEMFRMLSAVGLRDDLPEVSHPAPPYRWFNADWRELLHIDWSRPSTSGGTEVNFVHQPTLEEMFDRAVDTQPTVTTELGLEAIGIVEHDDHVVVTMRELDTTTTRDFRARFVVGADGANSLVRRVVGGAQLDLGFEADWLVVDILPNEDVTLDVPEAAQWCNPMRPTTIVPAGIREGRKFRRWEFMRLPGESRESLETDERAWELLEPWVRRDQAKLVRQKVYTFRSLLAERWRRDRLMIVGDAAHVMPPFMGQGMCAGLRDDWNLAWKLALVLDGKADMGLLDTYEAERRPHVEQAIAMSIYLGRLICMPDPVEAEIRDRAFLEGSMPPLPMFPHLTAGIIDHADTGEPASVAGRLCPHGIIRHRGRTGRFDDLVGIGFTLLLRHAPSPALLETIHAGRWRGMFGNRVLHFADHAAEAETTDAAFDLDGRFIAFMDHHGLEAMIARPDYYLFGGASTLGSTPALLERFADALTACGISVVHDQPPVFERDFASARA